MKRWSMVLGFALALWGAACTGGDGDGDGGVAGFLGTTGGTEAGQGGSGASHAGHGGSGASGHAGQGGTSSTAGTGGGAGIGVSGGQGGAGTGAGGSTSGTGGASGEGGSGATACGSRGLPECPAGSFCIYPEAADCGRSDAPGSCSVVTDVACGEIWAPVCGCDGVTYSSSCHAREAGASVDYEGECGEDVPPATFQCVSTGAMCFIAPPECPEGQVTSIEGACFGDCVPIEACACDGPEDCPNPETYTCHLSAGHCGPYTN